MDEQQVDGLENSFIVVKNIDHIIRDQEVSNDKNLQFSLSFYNLHQSLSGGKESM